jgi:hypothetical protein
MSDTPARSELKRAILDFCTAPRTLADIEAEFGAAAPKCTNNLALRREIVNINGRAGTGRCALYVDRRHARQYQAGTTPAK